MRYKVTLYLEADREPFWVPDTIFEAASATGEDLLDYHIEQYEEDDDE